MLMMVMIMTYLSNTCRTMVNDIVVVLKKHERGEARSPHMCMPARCMQTSTHTYTYRAYSAYTCDLYQGVNVPFSWRKRRNDSGCTMCAKIIPWDLPRSVHVSIAYTNKDGTKTLLCRRVDDLFFIETCHDMNNEWRLAPTWVLAQHEIEHGCARAG